MSIHLHRVLGDPTEDERSASTLSARGDDSTVAEGVEMGLEGVGGNIGFLFASLLSTGLDGGFVESIDLLAPWSDPPPPPSCDKQAPILISELLSNQLYVKNDKSLIIESGF